MPNYTYDPGEPYDGPPPNSAHDRRQRREYRRENETDDAWAAAGEDADADGGSVEELAAGYDWSDDDRLGVTQRAPRPDNLGPLPPDVERARRRVDGPRQDRIRRRYDRASLYPESPTFQRDSRQGPVSVDPFRQSSAIQQPPARASRPQVQPVPFVGILLLVILGMIALGAVILACVAVLFWL